MVLVIDNFDSFTYNLVQLIGELGWEVKVFRNDAIGVAEAERLAPSHLVVSPGPGAPAEAGVSVDMIRAFAGKIPILGVCLGHQAIGQAYGGDVVRAPEIMHGKISQIFHNGKGVFAGLASPIEATRYHSLIVKADTLPECLETTAWTEGEHRLIMGLRHRQYPVEGVQFHPESILTNDGKIMLKNFLDRI